MASPDDRPRPVGEVLGTGLLAGALAAAAVGTIDACVSWGSASQFTPGVVAHLRLLVFVAASHALAGALAGFAITVALLPLSRDTRLGDVVRFAHREHRARRANDPRTAVAGLALALAGLPCAVAALGFAYRVTLPMMVGRQRMDLVVAGAMAATLVALVAAVPFAFLLGRLLERVLALAPATIVRAASSPVAPIVATFAMVALGLAWVAHRNWETVEQLPLRGPLVVALALVAAIPMWRPARMISVLLAVMLPWLRRVSWVVAFAVLVAVILATGGSASVTKASSAYTGAGGPIVRVLRKAFDWDRDGYARFLGGGDCDDGDPTVHPGAAEIPDDGIDQNCVGGDSTTKKGAAFEPVAFAPVPASVPKDFDVVLITIDTTRADHLGAYGYARKTSPNLDKLAAEGTLFVNGWAHAPSTRYSMPAILTGRLPLDVYYDTTVDGWPGIASKATTIAEILQPLGFKTGAITNYWYFDRSRHMDQGFDEYDNENARLHSGVQGAGPEQTKGSSSKQQSDKAIAFVDRHANERFFLWVHYYDPHFSYELHPEVTNFGADKMALYDNEIAFTDMHIGRLIAELRAKGVYDKTVVVVTGDHGEGFGEHGVDLHGYHLYAAQTKVPLIVRVPGLPPRRATTPAGHVDILPTLANLAGSAPTDDMEGRSLVDVLGGAPDRDRVVLQQLSYEGNHEMRAAASRECHVIYNVSPDTSWEAYRVDRDPMETEDLADTDACEPTRDALARWYDIEQIPPGAALALRTAPVALAHPLDVALGTSVKLLGVDAPATAKPGDTVTLTWSFAATGRVADGWKLFVHLEGPNKVFYTGDHRPARPFEWWHAGQFISYTSTIAIPKNAPVGRYVAMIGMFKGDARAHVVAPKGAHVDNDAIEVARIEVAQ